MAEISSLYGKLVFHHEQRIEEAEAVISDANYQLGRLATAYSFQLHFDFEDTFDPETATPGRW